MKVDALLQENRDLQKKVKDLEKQVNRDTLTQLYNRRRFVETIEEKIARNARYGEHVALLFVDIDGLKDINDRHGHNAGDEVLRHVADIFVTQTRKTDMVARLGGDEFGILLDNVDPAQVEPICAKLTSQIADTPYDFNGTGIRLSASIGHCFVEAKDDAKVLMARADTAMYKVKRAKSED